MTQWHFAKHNIFTGKVAWNSYLTHGLRHNCIIDQSATEKSDPHVDYRFLLTRVEKCENWTRIREIVIAVVCPSLSCLCDNLSKHGWIWIIFGMWLVIMIILDGFLHGNIWSKGLGGNLSFWLKYHWFWELSCLCDNFSKTWIDLNNFLHVACNYHYLGWVLTWKYLKQGLGGKS